MKNKILSGLSTALSAVARARNVAIDSIETALELSRCKNPAHGDFSSNVAMQYAKIFHTNPRQLAEEIITATPAIDGVAALEIAGPGFINIRLSSGSDTAVLQNIMTEGARFGTHKAEQPQKILIEYVSANPTGPLHVGHGRGAAYGATLANILRANGHHVDGEYYVNDAGRQMDILALSVYWRYMQLCGSTSALPQGIYQGAYVTDIARHLHTTQQDTLYHAAETWVPVAPDEWTQAAIDHGERDVWIDAAIAALKNLLGEPAYRIVFNAGLNTEVDDIREDLQEFGVIFNRWFSERSLFENGQIEKTLHVLQQKGYLYEKDGALWFKSSEFGDEKDRVVKRENGITTYFSSDIAYHFDKYERGYDRLIDIFGADHHGYMARVKASLTALGVDPEKLTISLVQFAILYKNGEKMQMSTRSGQFVTLRDLRQQVGSDAARFFYVMRKPEQHLDFDLDLATSHSKDNPYYYVQYAHARTCRVIERAIEEGITFNAQAALAHKDRLVEVEEKTLLRELSRYPDIVATAGTQMAGHLIVNYLRELASAWHQYYDAGHKVLHDDTDIRDARLLLTHAVRQVLHNGLELIGVAAKERM
ncbi:MAG: arginine--tRNA ligase [Cardiobacteriaceae bacterium]|nr:arginine--tRNA ligase [Cardiobacteriaceae bacterium]